ncbi:MAG: DUF2851 family protein [Candidatus Amoebophilus sp.]
MKIREEWLHYIWKFQYFDKQNLTTCQGEKLTILSPGISNDHAGPDFLNAHIILNDISWHGHIELHVEASAWQAHKHHLDPAYENVILHVVWDNDKTVQQRDNTILPTLSLKNRTSPTLLQQYQELIQVPRIIPCENQIHQIADIVKTSMLDKALFQRLTNKNSLVYQLLANNQGDWEETAYQLLAYNFGFKVNSAAMLELSLTLPLKIIKKHRNEPLQLEALLLGQAGLLTVNNEETPASYKASLIQEYTYLLHKYQLNTAKLSKIHWKFFRLRPANFPTIRIAQLAQILHQQEHLLDWLIHTRPEILRNELCIIQSSYWQQHYTFGKPSTRKIPGLGVSSIENIFINTVVPLLVAYGKSHDQSSYVDGAIALLQSLPPEHNNITSKWQKLGMQVENAFDSQAFIELFNNFCTQKKCLNCNIGITLLKAPLTSK